MKKTFIMLTIAVGLVVIVAWVIVQPSQVGVYVYFNADTLGSTIQKTQEQFKTATGSRLNLSCNKEDSLTSTLETYEPHVLVGCRGNYTADNFVQLVRYQNKLFRIAETENLQFSSFADGVVTTKWLD